ncbi:MAG: hypothetical protein HZB19_11950 [Chloroflexi bacterium]|nr:hypothetical protein [Chloroflexota bacterium]
MLVQRNFGSLSRVGQTVRPSKKTSEVWVEVAAHYLNRFAQADTIVPGGAQGYDRYAYVNNSPLKYIDPSGHNPCRGAESGYKCHRDLKKALSGQGDLPDYGQYFGCGNDAECLDWALGNLGISQWEYDILSRLYFNGGSDAVHGVNYILANGIHIKVGTPFEVTDPLKSDWQAMGDVSGWYENGYIVLNPNRNTSGKMPDDWHLSIIVHEAWHIEQGPLVAFTKGGELEAYQVGLRVDMALEGKTLSQLPAYQQEMYNSTSGWDYGQKVKQYLPGYWQGLRLLPPYRLPYPWP